jgi:hypothetical protein
MLLRTRLVLCRRVLDHLRVDRDHTKRAARPSQRRFWHRNAPPRRCVLNGLSGKLRSVRWYQDSRVHRASASGAT